MDKKKINEHITPDYKQIYKDIIRQKYPTKLNDPEILNRLNKLDTALDVIEFNDFLFRTTSKETKSENQKLRSYDKATVLKILKYQENYSLNNSEVARHFKMSRNTIALWKKRYQN